MIKRRLSLFRDAVILSLIPALSLAFLCFSVAPGWFFWQRHFDPDYPYLLNALNVSLHQRIGHIDHPGTPLQLIGGVVLTMCFLGEPDPEKIIADPEKYLHVLVWFLQILLIATLWAVGLLARFVGFDLLPTVILQASVFFHSSMFMSMVRLIPEHFLLSLGILYFSTFLLKERVAFLEEKKEFIWGGMLGVALATKLTTMFWVFPAIFELNEPRKIVRCIGIAIIALGFSTCLIWDQAILVYHWIKALLQSCLLNGFDVNGIRASGRLLENIYSFVFAPEMANWFFLSFFAIGVALKLKEGTIPPTEWRVFCGLAIMVICQWIVVGTRPDFKYLLPVYLGLGPLIVLVLRWLPEKGSVGCGLLIVFCTLLSFGRSTLLEIDQVKRDNGALIVLGKELEKYSNYEKILYWGAPDPAYALRFGNSYAGMRFIQLVEKRYPSFWVYSLENKMMYDFRGKPRALKKGERLLFYGQRLEDFKANPESFFPSGWSLEKKFEVDSWAGYLLE